MPNVREGQYIVAKDRSRVLARFRVSVDIRGRNSYRWAAPAFTSSIHRTESDDRAIEPISHEVKLDYHVDDIVIWRYVGDAPHAAFDNPAWFEKV